MTLHVEVPPLPPSEQEAGENDPAPLDDQVMLPVGVSAAPPVVSFTVAVHVVEALSRTEVGAHDATVELARVVAVSVTEPVLEEWAPSPP